MDRLHWLPLNWSEFKSQHQKNHTIKVLHHPISHQGLPPCETNIFPFICAFANNGVYCRRIRTQPPSSEIFCTPLNRFIAANTLDEWAATPAAAGVNIFATVSDSRTAGQTHNRIWCCSNYICAITTKNFTCWLRDTGSWRTDGLPQSSTESSELRGKLPASKQVSEGITESRWQLLTVSLEAYLFLHTFQRQRPNQAVTRVIITAINVFVVFLFLASPKVELALEKMGKSCK